MARLIRKAVSLATALALASTAGARVPELNPKRMHDPIPKPSTKTPREIRRNIERREIEKERQKRGEEIEKIFGMSEQNRNGFVTEFLKTLQGMKYGMLNKESVLLENKIKDVENIQAFYLFEKEPPIDRRIFFPRLNNVRETYTQMYNAVKEEIRKRDNEKKKLQKQIKPEKGGAGKIKKAQASTRA
ncbi:MAG: hypothetical protein NUV57_01595, partial [archaeon]|nr:hypothetical protein [archaeon]